VWVRGIVAVIDAPVEKMVKYKMPTIRKRSNKLYVFCLARESMATELLSFAPTCCPYGKARAQTQADVWASKAENLASIISCPT